MMIVLWYDRKQKQILLEAKEQVGQPQFFMEQVGQGLKWYFRG